MKKGIFKYLNIEISRAEGSAGFVMLFAVTLASILLALALGVANIALREVKFSTSAQNTNDAFFAADSGIEHALFEDKNPARYPVPETGTEYWTFNVWDLGASEQSCAQVTVTKDSEGGVTIVSKGHNIGNIQCNLSNPDRIERELRVTY